LNSYFDPSFLTSLYSPDCNSAAAAGAIAKSGPIRFITTFAELEVVSSLGLRTFRHEISPGEAKASLRQFDEDIRNGVFRLRPLSEQVFQRAHDLSRRTTPQLGTRTADLLHVAAALELGAQILYSFDQQQRKLAKAVRLKVN
jgi:hypothetical protein